MTGIPAAEMMADLSDQSFLPIDGFSSPLSSPPSSLPPTPSSYEPMFPVSLNYDVMIQFPLTRPTPRPLQVTPGFLAWENNYAN